MWMSPLRNDKARAYGVSKVHVPMKFGGLSSPQAEQLAWYEAAASKSPYELLRALQQFRESVYMAMYEANKEGLASSVLNADGTMNFKKLQAYSYKLSYGAERSPEFKLYEKVLAEKLAGNSYLNKPGNTARELRAYIESLSLYEPNTDVIEALGMRFVLESNQDTSMMP